MVADAGEAGGLRPAVGLACLAAIAVGVVLGALRPERRSTWLAVALRDPPAALETKAREIVTLMGYEDDWADSFHHFEFANDYVEHVADTDSSTTRWEGLATVKPAPVTFLYRRSPRWLVPLEVVDGLSATNPPLTVSGMVNVRLEPDGRLVGFEAVPPQRDESEGPWPAVDWTVLFRRAGLDLEAFTPARPIWNPLVDCDERAAWEGTYSGQPDVPIRVEGGSYRGRPVMFSIIPPWKKPVRQETAAMDATAKVASVTLLGLFAFVVVGALLLARHNLRLGRGDRRGAFRLATYAFIIAMITSFVQVHHVASFEEVGMLFLATGFWLFVSALYWLIYIALEPYVRRLWPTDLIERSIGVAPSAPHGAWLNYLGGARSIVAKLCLAQANALTNTVPLLILFLLLRLTLRKQWAAIVAFVVLFVVVATLGSETPLIDGLYFTLVAATILFVLLRLGLLTLVSAFLFVQLANLAPLIGEFPAWYAETAVAGAIAIAALAIYSFYISLAGRPLFSGDLLEKGAQP
jgi:hypothetical protein